MSIALRTIAATVPLVLATLGWPSVARATEVVVVDDGSDVAARSALLVSGAIAFGVPYVISISVASESSHQGDGHLWVPIAGPWLDFTDRGPLPPDNTPPHDTEVTNRVLLVVDGVFQAAGALEVVSAVLLPAGRQRVASTTSTHKPWVRVTPMRLGYGGYGIGTLGTF